MYQKIYCASKKIVVYQEISLCSEKDCRVLEKTVVFSKRLLCSPKDCCALEKIVVFQKRN